MDYNNFYENRPPALTKSELVERIALLETLLAARSRCSIDFGDCMPDGHLPTNGDKRTYSECSCDDLEDDEKEFSEANESPVRDIPLRSVSTPPVYTSFFHKIMDNAKSMLSLRYNNKNATECQCDSSKVVNGDEESKSSSDSSMTYPAYTLTSSRVDTHKSSGESSSPTGKIPGKHISFEFDNTDNRVASREIFSYPSRNPQNLGCTCSLCKTCLPSTSSANENCATSVETTIDSDDSSSSSMEGQQQLIPKVFKISSHIEPTFSKMSVQSHSKKALHYCEHQPNRENQQHRGISTEVKVNEIALQNNPRVCETSTDPPSKKLYVKNAGVNFNPDELKIMTDTSMNHELQRHHVGVYFNPDEDLRMDGDSSRVKGAPQHHVGVYFNPDEDKMEGDTSKSLKKTMEAMMSTPDEHIRQLAVQQTHITNYMYPSVHYKHPHAANHQSHSEHCTESQRNASNVVNTVASDDKYLRPEHVNTTRRRRTQERRSVDYTQGSQQSNNSATSAVVTGFSLNDDLQQNEKFSQRIDEIEEVVQVLTATVAHSKKTCPNHSSRSVERSASKPEIIGNSTQTVGRRRSVSRANVAVRNENVPRRRRRSSCSPSVRRNSQSFSSSIELGNFQPDSINHANDNSETSYTRDHSTIAPLPPKKIFKETVYSFRTRNPEITGYCTMETCENKNVRTTGITNCSTNRAIYAPNYENGNNGCLSQGQGLSNRAIYAPNSENGNNICSSQGQGLTNGANYALNFENGNNGCSNQAQALADKNGSSTCKAVCATGYNVNTRYSFLRDNEANSPTNALAVPTNVDQKRSGCCPSACCPCSKSNIPDDFTKISQDLKLENVLLRNDLEDMKLELKQTLETLQGPMQHKLLEEQVKCLKLEEELEQTQKTMEAKEKDSNKEMQELRMELYCTTNNIDQLNEHNEKLKCELSNLSKMCAKLEEDLVKQKVMEADTIRLLTKKCQDEAVQKKSPCPPSKAKVSDTSDNMCEENLHVIARKLSETLKQCEPCEECAFFPPELSQAAKCIKNLTDMVDMHRVETECSQEEEPVRQPKPSPKRKKREKGEKKCNCTRKKKKSKHDGDRRDSECEKIDEATMKKEANTIACQCDLTQAKAKNCDETTETVAEIKIKYEVTDEIPGDVVEDKLEKEQEPGRPASCQCDLGLSEGVQVVELSNTKSGDEEDFQQCLDKCCTCSTENIKNDTTIREPPTETLSVSTSGPTSCYCSTQTSTGNTTYERIFSEQQPGFNSTLISTGTYNREQQVDVEVRAQFEYQDVAPITGTNDQTTVYFREPNSTINQDRPLGVFDKPTGFPFNVETEIDENVEPPTNFNVTTTVVDNGTIEVITEGATGVVETTLVYTPSGNIEVVTEILDDGPSVLPQSTFREDTPTTRGMMPEGTPTPMWVRPGDTQRGDKPCFCVKPVMNLPPPPPPPVYENTQMMQKPKDCTCKVPVTSMEPPPPTYRALPPERSMDRLKGCFCVKPESSIFPPAIEEKPKPEDVCSCPKQPEKIVNDPIKCTCVCTCSDPNGRYPDTCLAKETCGYRPKVEEGDVPPSEKPPRTCPANPKKICKCGGEPELPCDKLKKPSEMPKGEEQIVGEPREKEGFEFEETEAELGMKMELVYEQEIKEEKEEGEEEKPELEEGLGGIPLTEKESVYETAPEKFEEEYEEAMEGKGEEEMGDESVLKEHDFEKEGPPTEGESMIKEEGGEPGVTESKLGDKASRMTKEGEPIESDEGLTPKEEGEDLEETLILKGKESEMQKYEAEETLTAEEKELGIAKESSPVGSKEGSVTEKKEGLLSEEALKKSTEDAGKTSEEGVDVQKELSEEPIMKEPSEVKEELEVEGEPTEVTKEPSEVKDGLPPEVEESTELQREPSEVKKESSEVKKESSEVKKESSEVKKESAEIVEPSEAKKESVDAIEEPKKISEESIGKVETEVAGVDYEKLQKDKVSSEEGVCVCADQYPRESKIKKEQEAAEDEEAKRLAAEAERLAAEEAEHLAKEEADRLAAEETERLAAEEAERLAADEETDRLAKEEAELLAAEEAERLAVEEAERLAKEEADRLAAEEAERLAKEEAEHAAAEETTDAEDETHPLTEGDETTPLTTEEDEEGLEVVKEEDTQLLSAEGDEGEEEEGVRFPKDEVDELLAQLDEMEVEDYDMYLDELSELEDEMETAEEGEGDLGPKESEITEDYPPTDESGNVTPYSGVSTEMSSHYSEYREEHEYGDVICPTKTTCQSTVVKAQQDSTCQSTDKVDRSNQCNECRNVGVSTLASSETATEMVGSIGHDTLLGLTHEQLRELLKCPGIGALLETDTSKSKIKSETSFPTENDLENSELKELLEEIKEDIENAKTDRSIIDELDYSGHSRTSTCPGTKRGTCPIEICPGVLQQKIIERDSMVASSKRSLTIKDPPEVKVEPTRKRKCECPRTKPPTISHSETPKRRNEVGNIERRTLSETGKKKCTTFKETENFVNTAANLDRTEGDLSSPCCSCKKESPRAHPPECDCTKCICAPCHDPKILAQVQAELNKCKKPCAANLARERRMKAQRQAKVHMPNCTCVDCICMPTIKKLATTVEPPLPSKTPVYQVLTVSCACDKKNPKVPPQPPEPPPSPNSCYCGNCKCAPCKDKKKRKAAASGGKCTCEPCKCSPCKDPSKGMGCDCNPCECEDCKQLMIEEPEPEPPTLCTCGPCECKPICPIKSPRTRPGAKKEDADEPAPPAHPKTCTCIKCLCEECVDMILPQVGGKKREPIKLDDKGHPDGCDCDECACPSALVPVHPIDCTCGDCTCQGINEFQKIAAGIHPDDCDCTLCACVNLLEFQKEHAASCDCPECECSPCVYNMRKTIGCTCSICSCDDCTDLAKKKEKCTCETCKCAPSSDEKPPCICEDCNCSPDNMCDPNETELEAACDCEPTCACVDCADPNVQKKEETCDCTECHCESDASKSKEPKEAEENKEGKGKGCSCDVCKCDDGDTSAAACGTPGCTCPVCECLKAIVAAKNDVARKELTS
ncbi:uncharacterized protein LOC109603205 isoform X2 [Aethina tumida]|uniref:uncharacterized protein LOC109603205 isoform X2 n=1 Tax=Aethina tumida TaxID=116153 RepID=UPI0021475DE7|nr:uncharacterized protein LOC109603205 isoform X2 [Aethina tumida]